MSGISLQSLATDDILREWDEQYDPDQEFMGNDAFSFIQHKDYALKFLQKIEVADLRPRIPAKLTEIHSYFRTYFCTSIKSQGFFIFDFRYNWHIWYCIFDIFLIHIPTAYVILFLSIYSPDEHFYAAKMFPLFWGCSVQVVMAGIFYLAFQSDILTLVLDYALMGIFYRTPWTRCEHHIYGIDGNPVVCLEMEEFYTLTNLNGTKFLYTHYECNGSYFQSAEMIYYLKRLLAKNDDHVYNYDTFTMYYCAIWLFAIFFHTQLFKKYTWKAIDCLIWTLTVIYLITLLYLELVFLREDLKIIPRHVEPSDEYQMILESSDLAVSLNAPPVMHVIYSRSTHKTNPGWDSLTYGASNLIFNLFQDITYSRVLRFCESKAGVLILSNVHNPYPLFYLWPIFFKFFTLGPFYTKVFYLTTFLLEFLSIMITYQCLVEALTSKFPRCRWPIAILVSLSCISLKLFTSTEILTYLYFYGKILTWLTELVVIHFFYPGNRLLEDMKFFYYDQGITRIRSITLQLLPWVYFLSVLYWLVPFSDNYPRMINKAEKMKWIWAIPLLPVIVGAIFIIFKYVFYDNKKWSSLIRPEPSWGPKEHIVRQFRKKFDCRYFIDSLGPRFLNRHMLKRAEAPTYRLGVQYIDDRKNPPSPRKILKTI